MTLCPVIKNMLVHLGQFVAHMQLWLHVVGSQEAGSRSESDDREMGSVSERKRESTRGAPLMVDVSVCRSDGRQARISNN